MKKIKRYKLKPRSLGLKPITIIIALAAVIFTGWLVWSWLNSPFFIIRTLHCQVEASICSPVEEQDFLYLLGKNILWLDSKAEAEGIIFLRPAYESVQLSRQLPQGILVTIIKRKPIGQASKDNNIFYVFDQHGFVFGQGENNPSLPVVNVYPEFPLALNLPNEILRKIVDLVRFLDEYQLAFKQFEIPDNRTVKIKTEDGQELIFGLQKSLKSQVASLQLILSRSKIEGKLIKSLDLRFDKPVAIFKP